MHGLRSVCTLVSCLLGVFQPALATNGMNLIGFGSESLAMGGADLAVSQDAMATNNNPAGLMQIRGKRMDLFGAAVFALDVRHRDSFGNDQEVENSPIFFGDLAYAHRLQSWPVVLAIGLFAQGGSGYDYGKLNTAFGTQDELLGLFRIVKLTPGVAYAVNDRLSVGAVIDIVYSDIEQRIFPDTSSLNPADPAKSFFGTRIDDVNGINAGFKLGLQYQLNDRIKLGATYTSETELKMDGGPLVANFTALGLGRVRYDDVEVKGLNQPRQLGAGIAVEATDRLLLAADLSWVDWSHAVKTSTVVARNPDSSAAPSVLSQTAVHDWDDQLVLALGTRYQASPKFTLFAGYNYGSNPIPDEHLSPLLAATGEHHITVGAGYQWNKQWRIYSGLEYLVKKEVTYNNPDLLFGPEAESINEALALHITLSSLW
ncbi:MAG: outer membrane protein transport protein [Pseudomonadota bacterium]